MHNAAAPEAVPEIASLRQKFGEEFLS